MRAGKRLGSKQHGFTYVMVMASVALLGFGLAKIGPLWAEDARREQEADLRRAGAAYALAIGSYRDSSPGSAKRYPPDLDSLLVDTRFVGVRRHLRRLTPDPLAPTRAWGLLRSADGGVAGVFSQDNRLPFLQTAFAQNGVELPAAQHYSDWKFMPKDAK